MDMFVLAGCVFLALGLLILRGWRKDLRIRKDASSWPITSGKVIVSHVSHADPAQQTDNLFSLLFHYEVDGVTYTSGRIGHFGLEGSLSIEAMEVFSQRYPEGSTVQVQYDPGNPDGGILEPTNMEGASQARNMGLFVMAIGLFALYIATRYN